MFARLSGEQPPPPCPGGFRQPPAALQGRLVGHRCLHKVSPASAGIFPGPQSVTASPVLSGQPGPQLVAASLVFSGQLIN